MTQTSKIISLDQFKQEYVDFVLYSTFKFKPSNPLLLTSSTVIDSTSSRINILLLQLSTRKPRYGKRKQQP